MKGAFAKRFISFLVAAAISATGVIIAAADNSAADAAAVKGISAVSSDSSPSYAEYIETNGFENAANGFSADISAIASFASGVVTDSVNNTEVLDWKANDTLSFQLSASESAFYNIKLEYRIPQSGVSPKIGVKIDGEYPFGGAEEITLPRFFENKTDEYRRDSYGNELAPEQVDTLRFESCRLYDASGVTVEDYRFALTAGSHTVSLIGGDFEIYLRSVELAVPEKAEEYSAEPEKSDGERIVIEGENAALKTSSALVPKADTADAGMSPSSPYLSRINYIGGSSWSEPRDMLEWKFDVKKSGYYCFDFRYKQSDVVNGESYRSLKIDGRSPFAEAESLKFSYTPKWKNYVFTDKNGDPYYVYLEAGEHAVSLTVTLSEMSDYYSRLSAVAQGIGDKYIDIVKITGDTPDANLDYELFGQIPDLEEKLSRYSSELSKLISDMQSLTGKRGSQYIAAMKNMKRVIDIMVKRPYTAHQYVSDYYTNYSTLSSWLYDMKDMPIYLDKITLIPFGNGEKDREPGFFGSLLFGTKRFIHSFVSNYSKNTDDKNALTLWVNWGRDQATVLDSLIRDSFTGETGTAVNMKQVNASLINGLLAGNYPDVVLQLSRTDPVNLGIRGALYDLSQFDDYESVLTRFASSAVVPYTYNGKVYALPDTENFYIMFYRSDILNRLSLAVPKTWKEFLEAATVIQQNNMQVYVPYTQITTTTTVNAGIGSLNVFPTLMLQNGLSLYNSDKTATALTSPEAQQVFELWISFYRDYQFLKEADFYNRFRVGTMPMGIAPYSTYMTLADAAPELEGRFEMACVPGTENGSAAVAGSGTGCGIVAKSDKKAQAWEFLKWWTSASAQTRYASSVESVIGILGRPQTANVEAFEGMAWNKADKNAILEQWSRVEEIPEIPGSYYLTRSVDQAYWSVINGNSNVKDALVKWSRVADSEISRKINEYVEK